MEKKTKAWMRVVTRRMAVVLVYEKHQATAKKFHEFTGCCLLGTTGVGELVILS